MALLHRLWYTFIALLTISVFLATERTGALFLGFVSLWPSIVVGSAVGFIVDRRGAISASVAGAIGIAIVLAQRGPCYDLGAPPTWWELLESIFTNLVPTQLLGSGIGLAIWATLLAVLPVRQANMNTLRRTIDPNTGVVTEIIADDLQSP